MSDCGRIQSMLPDFVEEKLNSESSAQVKHHLESCKNCLAECRNMQAVINALHSYAQPRSDFWNELDNKLENALIESAQNQQNKQSINWLQQLYDWLRPRQHWAAVTAVLVLIVASGVLININIDQKINLVAQQERLLDSSSRISALESYKSMQIMSGQANGGSVSSFMPTQPLINYFSVGKYFGGLITALLVNDRSGINDFQGAIINEFKNLPSSNTDDNDAFVQLISNIDTTNLDVSQFVEQSRHALSQSRPADPQLALFDLGAWKIGFQYQVSAKSVDMHAEALNTDFLINSTQTYHNLGVITEQLQNIRNLLNKTILNDEDYLNLKAALNNIDRLMSVI